MRSKNSFIKSTALFFIRGIAAVIGFLFILSEKLLDIIKMKKYFLEFERRPDDIYISTYMKSGTTWLQMILHQLTSDGNMNFNHIYEISPFLEIAITEYDKLEHLPSPRIIKTHVPYKFLTRFTKGKGKIIYLMRDGRDVAVSLYHHCLPLFPENSIELSFDFSFDSLFLSMGVKKHWTTDENGWFGHMAGWLANKKKLNILYIKYEDLLEDLEGNIRKVGDFCGLKINEADLPRILERCSFKFMKKHQDKLDARKTGKLVFKKKSNDFIRKGKSKEWKHYFSKELIQDYEYLFNKFLGDFNLDCYQPTGVENHGNKNQ